MNILYIVFFKFDNLTSGSLVRPYQMYKAFLEEGHEIELLHIHNVRNNRTKDVRNFFNKGKNKERYDLCYIEPPTDAIGNFSFYFLLVYLRLKKIPIGLFYRDVYWKYDEEWGVIGLRKHLLIMAYRIDWFFLKHFCHTIFFPSSSMAQKFKLKKADILPPAGISISVKTPKSVTKNVVYVGGLTGNYGGSLLMKAMGLVNEKLNIPINLFLVCRKEEATQFYAKTLDKTWIKMLHIEGDENLRDIYTKCDVAIIPRNVSEYMNFSMPVKIFEYLSYRLPIIATDCFEVAKFINDYDIGIVVKDTPECLAEGILEFYKDSNRIMLFQKNVENAMIGNLWTDRVKKIINTLTYS